jgi:hypothetical protein
LLCAPDVPESATPQNSTATFDSGMSDVSDNFSDGYMLLFRLERTTTESEPLHAPDP